MMAAAMLALPTPALADRELVHTHEDGGRWFIDPGRVLSAPPIVITWQLQDRMGAKRDPMRSTGQYAFNCRTGDASSSTSRSSSPTARLGPSSI
jgi:hypothetical protein